MPAASSTSSRPSARPVQAYWSGKQRSLKRWQKRSAAWPCRPVRKRRSIAAVSLGRRNARARPATAAACAWVRTQASRSVERGGSSPCWSALRWRLAAGGLPANVTQPGRADSRLTRGGAVLNAGQWCQRVRPRAAPRRVGWRAGNGACLRSGRRTSRARSTWVGTGA
jgi:hypothetical protein